MGICIISRFAFAGRFTGGGVPVTLSALHYPPMKRCSAAALFESSPCQHKKQTPCRDMNCTPFVRQYGILSNKWGVFLCQKEYQTNDIRRNSKNW